jgi:hypothetical protein
LLGGTRVKAFSSRPVPVDRDLTAAVHEHLEIEVNWRVACGDGFDEMRRDEGQPGVTGHIALRKPLAARDRDQ